MPQPWMLLDANYLCHRAFHAFKQLSHEDVRTGVIYGFMRDILNLQDIHNTSRFVFCFDHGKGKRKKINSEYKANRTHDETHAEIEKQIRALRTDYLPEMGFNNIRYAKGYEAYDVIGSIVKEHFGKGSKGRAIIVSSDRDLLQLLRGDKVIIWSPSKKQAYTEQSLLEEFGITPKSWAYVKAMAGCSSDNLRGINGIGEKTAAKYLSGELKRTHAAYEKIVQGRGIAKQNMPLVRLPFEGTPSFELESDSFHIRKWNKLAARLGMSSLIGRDGR